jgi:hypothetical protein
MEGENWSVTRWLMRKFLAKAKKAFFLLNSLFFETKKKIIRTNSIFSVKKGTPCLTTRQKNRVQKDPREQYDLVLVDGR